MHPTAKSVEVCADAVPAFGSDALACIAASRMQLSVPVVFFTLVTAVVCLLLQEHISSQPDQQPSAASQPQGLGRQGQGSSRIQDSRAHSRFQTGPGRVRGRGTQGHSGSCTNSQGHQTPSGAPFVVSNPLLS